MHLLAMLTPNRLQSRGFAKPAERVRLRDQEREPAKLERAVSFGGGVSGVAVGKTEPVRDEPYRRLVAKLPCKNCGIQGYSQAAHPNTGKGAGTKTNDTDCFPLCCDRPGVRGCHSLFDQGALFSKVARRSIEVAWAADTRRQLGVMPEGEPYV